MKRFLTVVVFLALCVRASGQIYVDGGATGSNDGSSWQHAYTSLAAALTATPTGSDVWVAQGSYGPIELKSGVSMYGGFAGTEIFTEDADPDAHPTYIDGGGTAQAVTANNCNGSTVLRGFTIRNGLAEEGKAGGGVYLRDSSAIFVGCEFTGNTAHFAGGAVANYGGSPSFVNCRFHGNGAVTDKPTPVGGGAIFNHDGAPTFVNCLFYGNKAGDGGAAVSLAGAIEFLNCTFSDNQATKRRGGAIFDNTGKAIVRNSILWNNLAAVGTASEIYNNAALGASDIAHCNIKGGWTGTGNIDLDPLFVDPANGDFHLQMASPSRNAGSADHLPPDFADLSRDGNTTETLPRDIALQARVEGTTVDMGAFEWHP